MYIFFVCFLNENAILNGIVCNRHFGIYILLIHIELVLSHNISSGNRVFSVSKISFNFTSQPAFELIGIGHLYKTYFTISTILKWNEMFTVRNKFAALGHKLLSEAHKKQKKFAFFFVRANTLRGSQCATRDRHCTNIIFFNSNEEKGKKKKKHWIRLFGTSEAFSLSTLSLRIYVCHTHTHLLHRPLTYSRQTMKMCLFVLSGRLKCNEKLKIVNIFYDEPYTTQNNTS